MENLSYLSYLVSISNQLEILNSQLYDLLQSVNRNTYVMEAFMDEMFPPERDEDGNPINTENVRRNVLNAHYVYEDDIYCTEF